MHKSEDLAIEIAKNNQALFEDLATAQALFPDTPRFRELFAPIYHFRTITVSGLCTSVRPIQI
jgi:hypothetical protein